jgi:hypothetical protein
LLCLWICRALSPFLFLPEVGLGGSFLVLTGTVAGLLLGVRIGWCLFFGGVGCDVGEASVWVGDSVARSDVILFVFVVGVWKKGVESVLRL